MLGNRTEKASSDGRFIDCGEYIKDTWEHTMPDGKKVRLMWQKEDAPSKMTNKEDGDAESYCENSKVGGFKDWRLPEVEELQTLINRKNYKPASDAILNLKTDDWYWTKTPCAADAGHAWMVGFNVGLVNWYGRSDNGYVRAVRQY